MRRRDYIIGSATVLAGCSGSGGVPLLNNPVRFATAAETSLRKVVNPNLTTQFAGFSYEKTRLNLSWFRSSNTSLAALFKRISSDMIVRVGGDSVEMVTWDPLGSGSRSGYVAPADIVRLRGFLAAANAKVIYCLPLRTATPAQIGEEAQSVHAILADRLYGFEIGNEPDLYELPYPALLAKFQQAIATVRGIADVAIVGPDTSNYDFNSVTNDLARDLGSSIDVLTTHSYIGGADHASVPNMLLAGGYLSYEVRKLLGSATKARLGTRITEIGTYFDGGALGVSNVFGAALWAIDACFSVALAGGDGINFQSGDQVAKSYTPIADNGIDPTQIRAAYYGMFLFALNTPGELLAINYSSQVLFSTYLVQMNDGRRMLTLNNKQSHVVNGTYNIGRSITSATVRYLTAPSVSSVTGIVFGGDFMHLDGSWNPKPLATASGGWNVSLSVPPYTAALVELR